MKIAIIIISDPKAGEEVEVVFNGADTRWPEELTKVRHPANGLYNSVRETVKGASGGS